MVLTGFSSSMFGPKIFSRTSASSDESPSRDVLSCSKTSSNGIRSYKIKRSEDVNSNMEGVIAIWFSRTYQIDPFSIEILGI